MSAGQPGFWDVQDQLRGLSAQGDLLEKLGTTVDFEIFRAELAAALGLRDRSKGGRPAFDPVLKFRMLVLQAMHGLAGTQQSGLHAGCLRSGVLLLGAIIKGGAQATQFYSYGANNLNGTLPDVLPHPLVIDTPPRRRGTSTATRST